MISSHGMPLHPKKRALRGRRLVLVDIENVVGGAAVTPAMAAWARTVIESALLGTHDEQVVIGTSHCGLFNVKDAWPCARVEVRSGPDGADLELLEVLTTEHLASRFDEVVLVSGDGIFAEAVADLGRSGVHVVVAAWADGLSTRLRLAANQTLALDGWHGHAGASTTA